MIDPNQCLMEAYKFNIEPAHNYAETAYFTAVNLAFYQPAVWVNHSSLPSYQDPIYFTLVTYEVWINDFDRPDE